MANQVAARLSGDDYQHLYAWFYVLELLMPGRNVRQVTVEDATAGSVDDVTIRHDLGTSQPDSFHQVKYHVDHRSEYSTDKLIEHDENHASLLEKLWNTWKLLTRDDPGREVILHLVSNWTWDAKDKMKACIDGHDNSVKDQFFTASARSAIGQTRAKWVSALGADPDEFRRFIRRLRFRLGFDCGESLSQRVAERMENLGLKHDVAALKVTTGIVREWIERGRQEISRENLEATLQEHDLYLPETAERCVVVYLDTIKVQTFDVAPDYHLDWRDLFEGPEHMKGHRPTNPNDWNERMLPDIRALEARIGQETTCRFIRARGSARLSAWFAFGNIFSSVANYTLEVEQRGSQWRTDAAAAPDFYLINTTEGGLDGEMLEDGDGSPRKGDTVAVGISVTGTLDADVRDYLASGLDPVSALLLLRPEHAVGFDALRSANDLTALAQQAKAMIRNFMKKRRARRVLLFYFGPFSGACFLGHHLSALGEVQVMEDQQPGYASSFVLQ